MFIREGDPRRTGSHGLEEEKEEEQEEGGSIDTPAFSSFILFYGTVVVTEGVPFHKYQFTISLKHSHGTCLVLRFSKPDFGVTNCALMFSLEDEDVDVILDGCPLGHKRAIKRALKKGKNA